MLESARNRNAECARIEEAAIVTAAGARRTLAIVGEPGIGKTALLDESVRLLRRCGLLTARAKAEAIERDRPFGLIRRALDSIGGSSRPSLAVTDELLQGAPGEFRGLVEAPEQRFRVIDRITETIDHLAAERPIGLVLDDLQWADHGSLDTLTALHERLHDRALLILAATRPVPTDDRVDRFLAGVRRDDSIRLGPLDDQAVAELLTQQLGRPPTSEQLERFGRAGGNPLFIKTLVASDRSTTGADSERDSPDLPESVRRLVATQLRDFDTSTRELLQAAATIGGPFSLPFLADISGLSLREVIQRIDRAVATDLLVDDGEGLRFRHDLVRDVVYDGIAPSTRASLHLAIGRQLIERSASPADAAQHFLLGAQPGDVESAVILRQAAAEIGRVAPVEASQLLERALEVLPIDHPDADTYVVELAQSYIFSDRLDASVELVDERLQRGLQPAVEIDLRNARTQIFFLRGDPRRASEEFEAIASLVAGDAREPVVLADAAISAMFAVDLTRAELRAERSLAAAETFGDMSAPPLALGVLAWLSALRGDVDHGVERAAEAVARADRAIGSEGHRRIPHLFHAQALLWADRTEEAAASLRRGRRISGELGMGWDEPMYHALAADDRVRSLEWDDAVAEIEAGLRRSAEVGAAFADSWLHVHHARVLFAWGCFDDAAAALDRAMGGTAGRGAQGVDQVWWLRAMLMALDDPSAALSVLTALWSKLDETGIALRQFEYGPDLVTVALAAGDQSLATRVADRIRSLAEAEPSALGELARTWSDGLRSRDPERLELAATLADRNGHPLIAARARTSAALAGGHGGGRSELGRIGAPGWERWHLGQVSEMRAQRPSSGWQSLTPSERRVVELVGDGMTNAEIAAALNLSRRTVESHLYHSYPKLGISNRLELALFANRQTGE